MSEIKELSLIVIIYSLVVFIFIFVYGLIILFKLRRHEREINAVKRKLDSALQNLDLSLPGNKYQHNRDSNTIQDSIVDNHEAIDDTENVEFIKNALKNSKRHVSPATNSTPPAKEPKADNKAEIEENAKSTADLKNKIIDKLNQFDKPISYEHFSKHLNEDTSFADKHNLVFDLIDQLKEEGKIEIYFLGGNLLIKPK